LLPAVLSRSSTLDAVRSSYTVRPEKFMVFPTHRLDSIAARELAPELAPTLVDPVRSTVPAHREPLRICMMVTYDLAAPCGGVKHHAQQLAALRRNGD
jgi:hypothetical protein